MVVAGGCGRANDGAGGVASSNMARSTGSKFALGLVLVLALVVVMVDIAMLMKKLVESVCIVMLMEKLVESVWVKGGRSKVRGLCLSFRYHF